MYCFFFFQAEDGIRVYDVTGVQTCALPILFSPNKQRPIATLATLWSVTSFVRFLVALLASALLYYAAQFGLRPLLFSFLLAAVLLLICETRVIAGSLAKLSHSTED